jgi:hypothetical protein
VKLSPKNNILLKLKRDKKMGNCCAVDTNKDKEINMTQGGSRHGDMVN